MTLRWLAFYSCDRWRGRPFSAIGDKSWLSGWLIDDLRCGR